MTARDRIVIVVVAMAVILVGVWAEVVSPERRQASRLSAQVAEAQSRLTSAEGQLAHAQSAQSQYASAYAAMVNLGKAVPPSQEVPSLIYQLNQASNEKDVNFEAISSGGSSSSGSAASSRSSGSGSSSAAAPASFTQLPFTFTFEGSYFDLERLFRTLADFTTLTSSGNIEVSGRLLTIQSVSLSPGGSSSGQGTGASGGLTGSVTATAYVLPASEGLTGSATASSPAGAGASPAAGTAPASSPVSPAIVKVNP